MYGDRSRLPYLRGDVRKAISDEFDIDGNTVQFITPTLFNFTVCSLEFWRMWDTDIVIYDPFSNVIHLNTDGWETSTTYRYMNDILCGLPCGMQIVRSKKEWGVNTSFGEVKFHDDMAISTLMPQT